MSIEVKNLLKQYGGQKAVNDVSFSLNKGEIVGFLGPNGAGKSTTMKIITGYLKPDRGTAVVSGINVQEDPLAAKRKIGYLPEANPLYYDMYVQEYLGFVADMHKISNKKQKINTIVETVGLTPEKRKKTGQLSKGYKQRVGLAAALLHDPEVLVLDEPTTGLDPNQILEIRELIRSLGKNKTVLFSTHILQEVEAICDRVIIINKGRIVADNTLQQLQQHSNLNLVKVSFKEPLEPEWIKRLPGIKSVSQSDRFSFTIETSDPDTVRRELKKLEAENNLDIVSLQSENQSLEEVFRTLTGNVPPGS